MALFEQKPGTTGSGFSLPINVDKVLQDIAALKEKTSPEAVQKIQDTISSQLDPYREYARQLIGGDEAESVNTGQVETLANFLKNQFEANGIKPEDFVENFKFVDTGTGTSGLVNKNKSKVGSDYFLLNGQWAERNRTTGWVGPNDITNAQQADTRLKAIENEISGLNRENNEIKQDPARGWGNIGGGRDAVKANEEKINQLRQEYDQITEYVDRLKYNPQIDTFMSDYLGAENQKEAETVLGDIKEYLDLTPKELTPEQQKAQEDLKLNDTVKQQLEEQKNKLLEDPTIANRDELLSGINDKLSEVNQSTAELNKLIGTPDNKYAYLENEFLDPVMQSYLKSLEDPYNLQNIGIKEKMASRGLAGSGVEQENLGRLAAGYEQAKNVKAGNLTGDYYKNMVNDINQQYQNDVTAYLADIENAFKESGQTAADYFSVNQAKIDTDLSDIANKYNQLYSDTKSQYEQETSDYYNNMTASKNLFETSGEAIGGYFGSGSSGGSSGGSSTGYNWNNYNNAINNLKLDPWSSYNSNPYNTGRNISG